MITLSLIWCLKDPVNGGHLVYEKIFDFISCFHPLRNIFTLCENNFSTNDLCFRYTTTEEGLDQTGESPGDLGHPARSGCATGNRQPRKAPAVLRLLLRVRCGNR